MSAQANAALAIANERRAMHIAARRSVAAGERSVADVLADPACDGMRVEALLRAMKGVGELKAAAICARVPVSAHRKLRDLTDRQRRVLVEQIADRR